MFKLMTTVAATSLMLAASLHSADARPESRTVDIGTAGVWRAYTGTASSDGRPLCGVMVGQAGEKSLHIKWGLGDSYWTVMVWKPSWRIPNGTKLDVVIGFDKEAIGSGEAIGYNTPGQVRYTIGDYIEFVVKRPLLDKFLSEFRDSNRMWLKFPSGNETPWFADLTGSTEISGMFLKCQHDLMARYPNGTNQSQPYGKQPETSGGTQPFGSPGFTPDKPKGYDTRI